MGIPTGRQDLERSVIAMSCLLMSNGDIAQRLGIAKSTVVYWLKKNNVPPNYRPGEYFTRPATISGKDHGNWKGGVHAQKNGYLYESSREFKLRRAPQHRLVMERHIGRNLQRGEVVHHVDGNKTNNEISNLRLMTDKDHKALHSNARTRVSGGVFGSSAGVGP